MHARQRLRRHPRRGAGDGRRRFALPGTYVAGCYNRLVDVVDGVRVENESMVNLPNWLCLTMRADDGPWLGTTGARCVDERYELDLWRGVLMRWLTWRDGAGRMTRVVQERFVHMRRPHVCGLRTRITAMNWSGTLSVRSGVDGRVRNVGYRVTAACPTSTLRCCRRSRPGPVACSARSGPSSRRSGPPWPPGRASCHLG